MAIARVQDAYWATVQLFALVRPGMRVIIELEKMVLRSSQRTFLIYLHFLHYLHFLPRFQS